MRKSNTISPKTRRKRLEAICKDIVDKKFLKLDERH